MVAGIYWRSNQTCFFQNVPQASRFILHNVLVYMKPTASMTSFAILFTSTEIAAHIQSLAQKSTLWRFYKNTCGLGKPILLHYFLVFICLSNQLSWLLCVFTLRIRVHYVRFLKRGSPCNLKFCPDLFAGLIFRMYLYIKIYKLWNVFTLFMFWPVVQVFLKLR